jgi:hypothetical protein
MRSRDQIVSVYGCVEIMLEMVSFDATRYQLLWNE